jgi:hypothetical protein
VDAVVYTEADAHDQADEGDAADVDLHQVPAEEAVRRKKPF